MNIHKLSDQLSARALVRISDLGAIHAAGFHSIISNRPDTEDRGQPSSHGTRVAAQAHGLEAPHQPIVPGSISEGEVAAFRCTSANRRNQCGPIAAPARGRHRFGK